MNPRIRELLLKAGWDGYEALDERNQKFAELIVLECGEVAYKAYWANPETVRGRHIEEKIREHFGVKR